MLKRMELDNFRSFTHADLDLRGAAGVPKQYALIYGENGSGKTNLVEAVAFLRDSMRTLVPSHANVVGEPSIEGMADLRGQVLRVRTISSVGDMRLKYTISVDGRDAVYEMSFSEDGSVVHERLSYTVNTRLGRYFEVGSSRDGISLRLGSGLVVNRRLRAEIEDMVDKFWGGHTLLSILYAECRRANPGYVTEGLRPEILSIISYIDGLVTDISLNGGREPIWPMDPVEGIISVASEPSLDAYADAMDAFFTRLYTDVGKVYYRKVADEGGIRYTLMFSKRISEEYREVPVTSESSGTCRLLEMLPALLECARGAVVFIDEMDSGIHDKLVHDLVKEIVESVRGQLVLTTHNTSLIRDADPAGVYVISIDALGNKEVRSIDKIARTQRSHNNTSRYLNGLFGGVPYIGVVDLEDIAETLGSRLDEGS